MLAAEPSANLPGNHCHGSNPKTVLMPDLILILPTKPDVVSPATLFKFRHISACVCNRQHAELNTRKKYYTCL